MFLPLLVQLALAWDCGTDLSALGPVTPDAAGPRGGALEVRVPVTDVAGQRESDHFVVFWGSGIQLQEAEVAVMLDALEQSLQVETEQLGMPQPVAMSRYKLPVLVAYTGLHLLDGTEVPGCGDGCGYYAVDPSGYPMIVVPPSFTEASVAPAVLAHELFHATQAAAETFASSPSTSWFNEATATWAAGEVFGEHSLQEQFLWAMFLHPELPMEQPNAMTGDFAVDTHPYGEFLFVRHVSEHLADRVVVGEAYGETGGRTEILDRLDDVLRSRGSSVLDAVSGFAPVVWTLDVDGGETLRADFEAMCAAGGQTPYAEPAPVALDGAPHAAPTAPGRYGFAVFELAATDAPWIEVEVIGDATGSAGTRTDWAAHLLLDGEVHALVDGSLGLPVGGPDRVQVLAMPVAEAYVDGETFGVAVAASAGEAPLACGCRHGGAGSAGWGLAVLAAVLGWVSRRGGTRGTAR